MLKNQEIFDAGERNKNIEEFLIYAQAELRFSRESLRKYRSCLTQLARQLPHRSLESLARVDVLRIKARFVEAELSDSWLTTTLLILRRYLTYCRDEKGIVVLDPASISPPKRKRREVVYLTSDEVEAFIASIKLRTAEGEPHLAGLRFRALVEMLLGSGLRIYELLSLSRGQINFETKEAKIIGKGGKERVAFFTARALHHLKEYLDARRDEVPALFANLLGRGWLKRADIWRTFARHRALAGIGKALTPHVLRHTAATQLLFNGCPIGHIKEILGHSRLETTCRYYLGVDHRAAKAAHERFLRYDVLRTNSNGSAVSQGVS